MSLPTKDDFLEYSRELHPNNENLAIINAMSNVSQAVYKLLIDYMNLCDMLHDKQTQDRFMNIGKAIKLVFDSTMYNPTTKFYLDKYEESKKK